MLTQVKAYSSWVSAPTLPLSADGRAETDLIQVRNIEGLGPVKASINTSAFGSVDGEAYVGSSVLSRNIVLTLSPNPNWREWRYENLRRLLYSYFMPKKPTRLVFYSDDVAPVEIRGIVESAEINQFSKDEEFIVSIICPDPYFTALNPTIITGEAVNFGGEAVTIDYNGNVETGINVRVNHVSAPAPSKIAVQLGGEEQTFQLDATVSPTLYFELNSLPMKKFVQNINLSSGTITNLLSKVVKEGSSWPTLQPGENEFLVITDQGEQEWELRYFERFGGL